MKVQIIFKLSGADDTTAITSNLSDTDAGIFEIEAIPENGAIFTAKNTKSGVTSEFKCISSGIDKILKNPFADEPTIRAQHISVVRDTRSGKTKTKEDK